MKILDGMFLEVLFEWRVIVFCLVIMKMNVQKLGEMILVDVMFFVVDKSEDDMIEIVNKDVYKVLV